ncbi:MAG: GuaB3 family IMP dehydrogenase-related protein, partial [Actinomycetota bacterium]
MRAGTLDPSGSAERGDHQVEVEIGIGKSGRRAYGFDDIAIVPSRRTRDPEDVDISWDLDAFHFDLPLMASAMD